MNSSEALQTLKLKSFEWYYGMKNQPHRSHLYQLHLSLAGHHLENPTYMHRLELIRRWTVEYAIVKLNSRHMKSLQKLINKAELWNIDWFSTAARCMPILQGYFLTHNQPFEQDKNNFAWTTVTNILWLCVKMNWCSKGLSGGKMCGDTG